MSIGIRAWILAVSLAIAGSEIAQAQSAGIVTLRSNRTSANGTVQPTLTWSTNPVASSCVASGGWSGTKPASGSQMLNTVNATTNYRLTCTWGAGSVRIAWNPPTTNTNGSSLTNLARYRVLYGTSSSSLNQSTVIDDPTRTNATISSLAPGQWYFAIRAVNSSNVESANSNVATKNVGGDAAAGNVTVTVAPPPAGSLITNSRNAWDVVRRSDGLWVRNAVVGVIALGKPCSKTFRAGAAHFVVNRSDVTFSTTPRSSQIVVSCVPR
jgi:hypothetical protein